MSKTILTKVRDEDTYIDFEELVDLDLNNIIIFGNSRFKSYGNSTLLDIVKNDYYDDEVGYDYETFDMLEKVTGKKWEITTIKGYSQSDWQEVYYTKDISQEEIDEIENFYMGKVCEFKVFEEDDEESVYYEYVPDSIVWKGKKSICDYLGLLEKETIIYEELEETIVVRQEMR